MVRNAIAGSTSARPLLVRKNVLATKVWNNSAWSFVSSELRSVLVNLEQVLIPGVLADVQVFWPFFDHLLDAVCHIDL